ncbi:MAG: lipoate--protein ligase family protein [Acidobacteria bacterium]|nr:lipoate--protein ligase family protein [Acidobacteriota bacterium]
MTEIHFFPYETFSPTMNMAIDEYFLKFGSGIAVRLYGWNPPTISIGHSQDLEKVVNLSFCIENNIPVIRRSSGGGAVYHKNDITYMVSAPISVFQDHSVVGMYKEIANYLLKTLKRIGIPCHFAGTVSPEERRNGMKQGLACFLLPSDYEILAHDRKLVGSAQHRESTRMLQHGSIAWRFDYEETATCLCTTTESLKERVVSMNQFLPDLSIETVWKTFLETLETEKHRIVQPGSVLSSINMEKVIELTKDFPLQ